MYAAVENNSGNVPAFLVKLWTLVEDPSTDELIHWDAVSCFSCSPSTWWKAIVVIYLYQIYSFHLQLLIGQK